jgi:Sec-independent protein secretion pathway component TatC
MRNKGLLVPVKIVLWGLAVVFAMADISLIIEPTEESTVVLMIGIPFLALCIGSLYCLGKFVKANEKKEGN